MYMCLTSLCLCQCIVMLNQGKSLYVYVNVLSQSMLKYGKSSYAIVNVLSQSMFNQGKSLHVYVNVMSQSMLNQGKHIYVIVNYLFQSILNYMGISSENHYGSLHVLDALDGMDL